MWTPPQALQPKAGDRQQHAAVAQFHHPLDAAQFTQPRHRGHPLGTSGLHAGAPEGGIEIRLPALAAQRHVDHGGEHGADEIVGDRLRADVLRDDGAIACPLRSIARVAGKAVGQIVARVLAQRGKVWRALVVSRHSASSIDGVAGVLLPLITFLTSGVGSLIRFELNDYPPAPTWRVAPPASQPRGE